MTLSVREALPGVHPRTGGSERGNKSWSPQARVAPLVLWAPSRSSPHPQLSKAPSSWPVPLMTRAA